MNAIVWNKRITKEIEQIVNKLGYIFLEEYMSKNYRRVVIQDKIGYKYDVDLYNLNKGHIPYFVSKANIRFSLENISFWLYLNKPEFELCEGNLYKDARKKLKLYHVECQEYFVMSWDSISHGRGCPICSGHQVGKRTSLAYCFSEIASEWHPTKNGNLTPFDKTYGSSTKVWWLCSNGHEYCGSIASRTNMNSGCKQCSDEQKESKIATELKAWCKRRFKYVDPEHEMLRSPKDGILRCDIYLGKKESINGIYIEIQGHQHYIFTLKWYKTLEQFEYRKKLDKIKKKFAKQNGTYIEIDLRKIKTTEEAIEYIENILSNL